MKICSSLTSRISGLRPEVWLCVGSGFAREDVKALILSEGKAFVAEAIASLQEICLRVSGISADRVLAPHSREEIYRRLIAEPKIIARMPEIKRLKRRSGFFSRLDVAIQSGRRVFAHFEEEEVYEERLRSVISSPSPDSRSGSLRSEVRLLARAYEAWLGEENWYDLPLLLHCSIRRLREGWPDTLVKPREVCCLSVQAPESLEREFWDTLAQHVEVNHLKSFPSLEGQPEPLRDQDVRDAGRDASSDATISWQRWHTLDDAAEHLADQILIHVQNEKFPAWEKLKPSELAILIPDQPSVRRTLRRALESRRIPLAEPRDPTRLRWDENLKWALLPLEVVASNFERQKVISWLRGVVVPAEFAVWVNEINSRGIKSGLGAYAGGSLSDVHTQLSLIHQLFGGKKTALEFAAIHLKNLRESGYLTGSRIWLIEFIEQIWKVLETDLALVGQSEKKASAFFWLEKLASRIRAASPPAEKLKPAFGVSLYRLQQAPVGAVKQLWILGLPAESLSGEGIGDYWFSEREREILSAEFAVRSSTQVSEERLRILQVWLSLAEKSVFLDSHYDEAGRERESILPILKQLEAVLERPLPEVPLELGAHQRFCKSYGSQRPLQPQEINLGALNSENAEGRIELTATAIDRYSRCSFQALCYHRWKLKDVREPDSELWPDVRGNILHDAVGILMRSEAPLELGGEGGDFRLTSRDALEDAWKKRRPSGLIRNQRVEAYIKNRMTAILEMFREREKEYRRRSKTRPMFPTGGVHLKLDYPAFSILGQPDRVDEHQDGLFILDYKTSGTSPHGQDMVKLGYRLQLPFYAIAIRKKSGRPVLGVQFVELDRKGRRKNGIFFKKYNGKDSGCLTQVRSNSKSLIPSPPEELKASEEMTGETWDALEESLVLETAAFVEGRFRARPKLPKREAECAHCGVSDLCGYRRLSVLTDDNADAQSEVRLD